MMRRYALEFTSGRYVRRIPRQITSQIPSFLSSRKEFSAAPQKNASQSSGSTGKPSESGSHAMKFVIGSVAVGAAVMAAYQTGYLKPPYVKEEHASPDSAKLDADNEISMDIKRLVEQVVVPNNQETNRSSPNMEHLQEKSETQSDIPHLQDLNKSEGDGQVQDSAEVMPAEDIITTPEKDLPSVSQVNIISDDQSIHSVTSTEDSHDTLNAGNGSTYMKTGYEQKADTKPFFTETKAVFEETEMKTTSPHHVASEDMPEETLNKDSKLPNSLLDTYFLQKDERSSEISLNGQGDHGYRPIPEEKEAPVSTSEDLKDAYLSNDGKLVLDFLQAIHTAEKRQAELDAHIFADEKKILKEKYEKELKDARARELMFAEEAAILDKELNKERTKAAAAIKTLQEKSEERLKMELEHKENEAELQLKKVQELAKAELAAAIASEKASQIEKMAEANLHIDALCMAFYTRSEEARQSHSVHKLALGTLALEDTLSKGLPIKNEIDALHTYLEDIDRDSLFDLVLSSLPEETLNYGTDTQLQLNQKFDAMKGALRHFSFVPPGGGGILAHTLAHIASWLKIREDDQSGDGIESLMNRVESFLAEGKLAEAADVLEGGVNGSQAEEIIGDWVRRVRNRAITEQALSLLQSYATSISLT